MELEREIRRVLDELDGPPMFDRVMVNFADRMIASRTRPPTGRMLQIVFHVYTNTFSRTECVLLRNKFDLLFEIWRCFRNTLYFEYI